MLHYFKVALCVALSNVSLYDVVLFNGALFLYCTI